MSKKMEWINPDVTVTNASDGSLILENNLPLADYPANLVTWLHHNTAKFPDKLFLQARDKQDQWHGLTYAETLTTVNRLSNGLVAMGLTAERPIAILSENSINMALLQLAAMQVGLPVAPVSYAYSVRSQTGGHIKHILDVTKASLLVMSNADLHMSKLNQWDFDDLRLYAFSNSASHPNVEPFEVLFADEVTLSPKSQSRFEAVTPDTLAKIQFTSGSTNLPKGVEVTHGMMTTNQVGIYQTWPFLDSDEVVVDWLPWNHTFGGNFVFNMVLMHGGTFYIDNGNPTPMGLAKTVQNIKDMPPTMYFGVPRSYTALFAQMKADQALKQSFLQAPQIYLYRRCGLGSGHLSGHESHERRGAGRNRSLFLRLGSHRNRPGCDSRLLGN